MLVPEVWDDCLAGLASDGAICHPNRLEIRVAPRSVVVHGFDSNTSCSVQDHSPMNVMTFREPLKLEYATDKHGKVLIVVRAKDLTVAISNDVIHLTAGGVNGAPLRFAGVGHDLSLPVDSRPASLGLPPTSNLDLALFQSQSKSLSWAG